MKKVLAVVIFVLAASCLFTTLCAISRGCEVYIHGGSFHGYITAAVFFMVVTCILGWAEVELLPKHTIMRWVRKLFGGCFAAVAVTLFPWRALTTPVMTRYDGLGPYFWNNGPLVLFAAVQGMAAWTAWRGKPGARVWGVLASLLIGSLVPLLALLHKIQLSPAGVLIMVLSGLALITFAWPNRSVDVQRDAGH